MTLRVLISYAPHKNDYPRYGDAARQAVRRLGLDIDVTELKGIEKEDVPPFDGVIFTGGGDINPKRYGKPELEPYCTFVNDKRDEAEFALCKRAVASDSPILGICRGEQLLNVHFGGTLVADIATAADHVKKHGKDSRHAISIEPGSTIERLAGSTRSEVNSSHHQAVDRLAEPFVVTARASDGTIEAYEWAKPEGKPFLLAVQWHPERMNHTEPLAGPIFELFLKAVAGSRSHA